MKEEKIIIDAENATLGRLASFVAKHSLLGKSVIIINSEKAIIIGNKKNILETYQTKRGLGGPSLHGPFFPSFPEKILKRTIRGMLPHKKESGRSALKRVVVYNGVPKEYENVERIKSGKAKKGMSLEKISKLLRGEK